MKPECEKLWEACGGSAAAGASLETHLGGCADCAREQAAAAAVAAELRALPLRASAGRALATVERRLAAARARTRSRRALLEPALLAGLGGALLAAIWSASGVIARIAEGALGQHLGAQQSAALAALAFGAAATALSTPILWKAPRREIARRPGRS